MHEPAGTIRAESPEGKPAWRRPLSLTIIGWLFILVGGVALLAGLLPLVGAGAEGDVAEFEQHSAAKYGLMLLTRAVALVSGAFLLRGAGWARRLLALWMGFHLVLSARHSPPEFVTHALLFAPIVYFLYRDDAARFLSD